MTTVEDPETLPDEIVRWQPNDRPLVEPRVEMPIAFLVHDSNRPSRTLAAALAFAQDAEWLAEAGRHSGALDG